MKNISKSRSHIKLLQIRVYFRKPVNLSLSPPTPIALYELWQRISHHCANFFAWLLSKFSISLYFPAASGPAIVIDQRLDSCPAWCHGKSGSRTQLDNFQFQDYCWMNSECFLIDCVWHFGVYCKFRPSQSHPWGWFSGNTKNLTWAMSKICLNLKSFVNIFFINL